MPDPIKAIISGTGTSAPMSLNPKGRATTIAVTLTGGTCSYGLEVTLDDIMNTPAGSVRWIPADATIGLPSGTTASGLARISSPVQAARLNVASLSGGNLEMRALQS